MASTFLTYDRPALGIVGAVILHLFAVPAGTDAEHEAAIGDHVQRRHFFGQCNRIPLDDQADAGAELYAIGHRRRCAQRNEGVVGMPVHFRQIAAAGEWRGA